MTHGLKWWGVFSILHNAMTMSHLDWIHTPLRSSCNLSVYRLYVCMSSYTAHLHWTFCNRNSWLTKHTHAHKPTHTVTASAAITLSFFLPISSPSFLLRIFSRQRFFSADPLKHRDSPWAHSQTHTRTPNLSLQSLTHTI